MANSSLNHQLARQEPHIVVMMFVVQHAAVQRRLNVGRCCRWLRATWAGVMEDGLHFQPSFLNVRPDASSCYTAQGKTGTKVRTVTTRWHAERTLVRRKKVAVTRQNKKKQSTSWHRRGSLATTRKRAFLVTLDASKHSKCHVLPRTHMESAVTEVKCGSQHNQEKIHRKLVRSKKVNAQLYKWYAMLEK